MKRSSNLLLPVFLPLTICGAPAAGLAADNPPKSQPAPATVSAATERPPLMTQNPDGTMMVQKQPQKGTGGDTKNQGLVIPPQIVVPTVTRGGGQIISSDGH